MRFFAFGDLAIVSLIEHPLLDRTPSDTVVTVIMRHLTGRAAWVARPVRRAPRAAWGAGSGGGAVPPAQGDATTPVSRSMSGDGGDVPTTPRAPPPRSDALMAMLADPDTACLLPQRAVAAVGTTSVAGDADAARSFSFDGFAGLIAEQVCV